MSDDVPRYAVELARQAEQIKSLSHRVHDLEEAARQYATLAHLGRIERIIWIVGTAFTVGLAGAFLTGLSRLLTWAAQAAGAGT